MRISDWSSDVCSSDLLAAANGAEPPGKKIGQQLYPDRARIARRGQQMQRHRRRQPFFPNSFQSARLQMRTNDEVRQYRYAETRTQSRQHGIAAIGSTIGRASCRETVVQLV